MLSYRSKELFSSIRHFTWESCVILGDTVLSSHFLGERETQLLLSLHVNLLEKHQHSQSDSHKNTH